MKRLHQVVGLFFLVLWVPITAHCTLESISALAFLKCAGDGPESNNQCNGDACSQLETATYKVSDSHTDFLLLSFTAWSPLLILEFPPGEQAITVVNSPPEIRRSWQFSFRTALPPRAPSFVS